MSKLRPQVTIPDTETHLISSSNINQDFSILVALPHTYAKFDKAYPALYVLDANGVFGTVTETVRMLTTVNAIPEIIIIGIAYPVNTLTETFAFRTRDYTPTRVDEWYKEIALPNKPNYCGSGGAPQFLRFIREELMPFINATYRTIPQDDAILGFSFGGLFALYTLFDKPNTFQRYIIGSPTVWWDESVILNREQDFAANNTDLPAKLFMSVGSNENERMVTGMQTLAKTMQDRRYKNLEMKTHIFEDETHTSVAPATISRGLRVVFV
ncbi:MAG TPA: alpha/beta hydrolase-fold protein [Waterburya sp.]|jgi:hypothetical protein